MRNALSEAHIKCALTVWQMLQMAEEWYGNVSQQSSQQSTTMPWQPPTPIKHPWSEGSITPLTDAAGEHHASGRSACMSTAPCISCYKVAYLHFDQCLDTCHQCAW